MLLADAVVFAFGFGWLLVVASLLLASWYLKRLYREMFAQPA